MNQALRIMVVDDDAQLRKTLSDVLRIKGYVPLAVATGKAALEMLGEEAPVVALIDLRLEDMPGLKLMEAIKERSPDTECIVITGHASQTSAIEAVNLGAYSYLQKPYPVDQLLLTIHQAVEKREAVKALEQHAAHLAILNDIGGKIAAVLDLDRLLDRAVRLVQEGFGYHHVSLFTVDRGGDELVMRAIAGSFVTLFPPHHRIKRGQGMVGWVGCHGQTLLANDVDAEPHYANFFPDLIPTRSELSVPIRARDEVVGVLDVQSPHLDAFGEHDVMMMETLADQIAVAIQNARLYEETKRRVTEMTALHKTALDITAQLEMPQLLNAIIARASDLLGATGGLVHLYDPVLERLQVVTSYNLEKDYTGLILEVGEGVAGRVFQTGEPLILGDHRTWAGRSPQTADAAARSMLGVPLKWQEQIIGVLDVMDNDRAGAFDEQDLRLLVPFATQATIAIRNARLFEETSRRTERMTTLNRIGLAITSDLDLAGVLNTLYEQIKRIMDVGAFYVALYDEETGLIHFPLLTGIAGQHQIAPLDTQGDHWPGLTGYIIQSRQPLYLPDTWTVPEDAPYHPIRLIDQPARSYIGVPLIVRERVIGVLSVQSYEPSAYTMADVELLTTIASQASIAIDNARLYEETRRRNRELALLNRVIAASSAGQRIEPILETVCRELALYFGVPQSAAALFNEEKTEAVVVAEYLAEGRPLALGETIPVEGNPSCQYILKHKAPLVVDDAQTDPRLAPIHDLMHRRGTVSLLILPLLIEGEVVGSLGLDAIEPRPFTAEEVDLAQRVAGQVSSSLARARLAETQHRLGAAVEQVEEAVLITDTAGIMLYVNPAFEQITGYPAAQALGQHISILKSDKQDAAFYRTLERTLAAGQGWQGRMVLQKRDGELCTGEMTIAPVRDQAGEIVNYAATMRDVTREIQLEEQFRQAQKMEALGRLAGGIAHDFNNLLTVIYLSTRLLERQLHSEDPLREHVQRIQETSQRAAKLTKQLLSFSRKEVIQPQVLNLNAVVGHLSQMLQRIIGEDIELITEPAEDLWPVSMDPTQVEQVILNLVINARDAMPRGGRLTIEMANVVLDEAYLAFHVDVQPGEYVRLSISDTGVGMDNEVKAHLFEPFFTTKERGVGTGLGLSTVHGIVKQNRGHIRVYSEVGRGTTFKIYLPRAGQVEVERPSRVAVTTAPRGSETVLVVEDEADVRNLIVNILRTQGYRVLAAESGPQALTISRGYDGPVHLLLTDVVMPQMNGWELAEQLRPQRPEMRVLYMSGYADNRIARHDVLEEGAAFVSKPLTVEGLTQKVRAVLDRRA